MKLLRLLGLCGLALPAFGQYAGPAILSRGEAPAAMSSPKVDFSFSVAVTGTYTNGLAGVSAPDSQGQLASRSSFGEGLTFGLSGAHSWKHTHVGMYYSGSLSNYSDSGFFDGMSHGLSFGLTHQFARHLAFSLRETAGMFTRFVPGTVALNSSVPFDPSQSFIPTTDFYDNRTIYSSTQANVTFQKSARLSFDFGGGYFTVIRRSSSLFGAAGQLASGDVQYRLSRRTTIGANYGFYRYGYPKSIGGANIHIAGATVSVRLSRWTEFSLFAGAARVESDFQQTVPIDPQILGILCPPALIDALHPCTVTGSTVNSHNLLWAPNFGARYSRSFRRGVAYISAGESISPGNGLFLTSRAATATAGYGYTGLRKWSLGVGVSYITALSLGNVTGNYGQVSGSYSMSRQIVGPLSFVSSLSATQYQSDNFNGYNRLIYSVTAGLGFSSKNIPIRFF